MKLYITRCRDCPWTGEKVTRPDAQRIGQKHEEDEPGHETDVEVFTDG